MPTLAKTAFAAIVLLVAICANAQSSVDFSGHWRQNPSSALQRQLEIEQNGQNLLVRTILTNSEGTRHLEVKYQIGGPETTYTGLDGDEFHTTVHWDGSALVFDITERENGKDIPQKTVWTLSADGNTLQVDRTSEKSGKPAQSAMTYVRQAPSQSPK